MCSPGVQVPPHRGGACGVLPRQEGGLPEDRPRHHPGGGSLQDRTMGSSREVRRQGRRSSTGGGRSVVVGVVLLQLQGSQVPERHAHQPRHGGRVLEGHRLGQAGDVVEEPGRHRHEEDAGVLQGPRPQRPQDQLDHPRVPPPDQRARPHAGGRRGGVPRVPEASPQPEAAFGLPGVRRSRSRWLLRRAALAAWPWQPRLPRPGPVLQGPGIQEESLQQHLAANREPAGDHSRRRLRQCRPPAAGTGTGSGGHRLELPGLPAVHVAAPRLLCYCCVTPAPPAVNQLQRLGHAGARSIQEHWSHLAFIC